jgi:hypothetical protein
VSTPDRMTCAELAVAMARVYSLRERNRARALKAGLADSNGCREVKTNALTGFVKGFDHPNAKIPNATVARIRALRARGLTYGQIERALGLGEWVVSRSHIARICRGERRKPTPDGSKVAQVCPPR